MATWTVVFEEALAAWEGSAQPTVDERMEVLEWLLRVADFGPPDDHLPVPLSEDLYVSSVGETGLLVTYLALGYERRVIVRRIG